MPIPATPTCMPADSTNSNKVGRPRKIEAHARQRHLLAVATELFTTAGYHAISLARIASEARVAVRTIYTTFDGKAGLFHAILNDGMSCFLDDNELLDPAAGNMTQVLTRFGWRYLCLMANPDMTRMRYLALTEVGQGDGMKDARGMDQVHLLLARYFSDEKVRRELAPDVPVDHLPDFFLACIAGSYLRPVNTPVPVEENALRKQLHARVALFLRAVMARGGWQAITPR
ncbi:TetR/AcrR family transcriptional regulator [Rugamonas apoptosis]|uniref:TetR/AcrR family transcriptional regulator n=1 Tax=Rugamonas apoptosis TaxID=2758570 RepID=A0A7W2FBX2_9BURK|nr:TetR/AcrR family transcriptional regulator [Rugamonas apoptosis]MBA5688886.1 TetR/AcrR family transcriptional regulator [Rugamonas apoptosis]